MRAVLIATGYSKAMEPIVHRCPTALFRLVDRPIIFHIVEQVVKLNISSISIVLHHLPELIEEALDSGTRWGINITYHLAKDAEQPFSCLIPAMQKWDEEPILLGQGDRFSFFSLEFLEKAKSLKTSTLYLDSSGWWTGWGMVSSSDFKKIPTNTRLEDFPDYLSHVKEEIVSPYSFSSRSFADLKSSNLCLIKEKSLPVFFPSQAKVQDENIWLSRASVIDPLAILKGPLFIGEHCHIKNGAIVGPGVVIENHCIVDSYTELKDSLVCQNTYVGEKLTIYDSVINHSLLVNVPLDSRITFSDKFMLCKLSPPTFKDLFFKSLERVLALILFLFVLPLMALLVLRYPLIKKKRVRFPTSLEKQRRETFEWWIFEAIPPFAPKFVKFLPSLWNVIKGDLHFVGLKPRSERALAAIPEDSLVQLMNSKIGLISLADLEATDHTSFEEQLLSESYYCANKSVGQDLKIFFSYLKSFRSKK